MTLSFPLSVLAALCSLLLGLLVALESVAIPFIFVGGLIIFVAADRLSLYGWCSIILASAVMSRAATVFVGLPTILEFLHYPLVLLFALLTTLRTRPTRSRMEKSTSRWLLVLVCISLLSAVINGTHLVRAFLFLLILTEPLLLLWAIPRWKSEIDTAVPRLLRFVGVAVLIQIALVGWQVVTLGTGDFVQGTFVGHGAGAHVLGANIALVALIVMSGALTSRIPWSFAFTAVTLLVAILVAADAKQVIGSMLAAFLVMIFASRTRARGSLGPRRLSVVAAGGGVLLLVFSTILAVERTTPGTLDRVEGFTSGYGVSEVTFAQDQAQSGAATLLIGYGPGTTASRASLLLTPAMLKEDSPVAALGLPPTQLAGKIVTETRNSFGGSVESLSSSTLGIIGDIGLAGIFGLGLVVVHICRHLLKRSNSLKLSALGALAMTLVLAFVDNWLEYPEFMVPLAVLLGLALAESPDPNARSSITVRVRS